VPNEVAPLCIPPTIRPPGPGPGDKTVFDPWGPGSGGLVSNAIGHRVEIVTSEGAASERAAKHLPTDFDPAAAFGDQRALNAVRWTLERDANGQETWARHLTDANGNLAYDGKYFYQYDAWNRLIQINDASQTHWIWFEWTGQRLGTPRIRQPGGQYLGECPPDTIGPVIKHYNYDGVGRLYRTSSPLQAPEGLFFQIANPNPPPPPPATQPPYLYVSTLNRSERFFYDGTRRVQELITDPLLYTEEGDAITMANELYAGQPGSNVLVAGAPYVRAMYVWGPGDSPTSGVDELIVQIDPRDTGPGVVSAFGGKPWWALSDAQGDVIALLHRASASTTAEIAAQWTYSPYGEVLTYEQFHPHPVVVFGHKSLVVDRLDSQSVAWDTDLGTLSETQRLIPGARLLSYARNRTYAPSLGRWLQQDPNASGQKLSQSIGFHGRTDVAIAVGLMLETRASDGLNLFGYTRSNPIMGDDPLGLFVGSALMPYATLGATTGQIAYGLASGYADNESFNADWASDWSLPDDWHTRGNSEWIQDVYDAAGVNNTVDGYLDVKPVPPPDLTMGSARGVVKTIRIGGKLLSRGWKHHVLPKYLARIIGKSSNLLVRLPKRLHVKGDKAVHKHIDNAIRAIDPDAPLMNSPRAAWTKWAKGKKIEEIRGVLEQGLKNGMETWARAQGATKQELAAISKLVDDALGN
jgi:hypothetical protein